MAAKDDIYSLLSHVVGTSEDVDDLISYLESFTSKQDLEEYLYGILDENNATHCAIIDAYLEEWKPGTKGIKKLTITKKVPVKEKFGLENKFNAVKKFDEDYSKVTKSETPQQQAKKGKMKYSPLQTTKQGNSPPVVQLPGRRNCDCEASKHNLINNCLHCGRIVCEQEGSGPCTFCGHLVCTKEEQEIINRDSKTSSKLLRKLMGSAYDGGNSRTANQAENHNVGLQKAVDHKNKLLEFDQTVEKRTKIIDDQSDYYTMDNLWLTHEERKALMKKNKALEEERAKFKKTPVVTFDFAGRQVIEEKPNTEKELQKAFEEHMKKISAKENLAYLNSAIVRSELQRPTYDDSLGLKSSGLKRFSEMNNDVMRLQGNELLEMSDQGFCLSLHQPYASLLVAGLKLHEGRSWYTPIRGRLWIASTAQEPSKSSIKQEEEAVRVFRNSENVKFPENYPVGALLGCVTLVDCLPQEEYREKYNPAESDSPFVFICENPQELIVKFPNRGKHKIYKLDPRIHEAAKKTLRVVEE